MNKILKNSFLGTAVLILFFLIAAHPGMAEDVPPLPMTVNGVAFIDGSPAPVDTAVAAYLNGEYVEQFLINNPSGNFTFYISGKAEDEGKPVTFTIDEKDTGKSFTWKSGTVISSVELSVGDSGSSKKSSTSNSGSGSLAVSGDKEEDREIIENSAVTQPDVEVPEVANEEKTVQENADDEVKVEKTEGSSDESSKKGSAPGFQIIYAVAGIILLTFGSKLWRDSKRKP
ncbi:hypothetical protein MSMAT_1899 [Methanosarcina mazei TMA]|nr:hypothetical protein MSMAT_1899 [Methanosarcina mazei TMA]BBL63913.1 hypothetical protein MmazTMA_08900 [Methanosarcina mazei]